MGGPTRESRAMLVVLEVPGYLVHVTTRGLRSRGYKLSLVTDPEVMAPVRVLVFARNAGAMLIITNIISAS
jgi:hypothetical protein